MADALPAGEPGRSTPHIRINSGSQNPFAESDPEGQDHHAGQETESVASDAGKEVPEDVPEQDVPEQAAPAPPLAPPPPPPPTAPAPPVPTAVEMPTTGATVVPEGVAPGAVLLDGPQQDHMIGCALTPGLPSPALSSAGTFQSIIASPNPQESSELLIPPRTHRARDEMDPARSPDMSVLSSRRTSWSSTALGSNETPKGAYGYGYGYSPFEDSREPSQAGSEETDVNTQTVSEKYNIMPTEGLLLFPEDVEKDDYLHNPDTMERDRRCCDYFSRRGFMNIGGLLLFTLGLLTLFIAYPVMYV